MAMLIRLYYIIDGALVDHFTIYNRPDSSVEETLSLVVEVVGLNPAVSTDFPWTMEYYYHFGFHSPLGPKGVVKDIKNNLLQASSSLFPGNYARCPLKTFC